MKVGNSIITSCYFYEQNMLCPHGYQTRKNKYASSFKSKYGIAIYTSPGAHSYEKVIVCYSSIPGYCCIYTRFIFLYFGPPSFLLFPDLIRNPLLLLLKMRVIPEFRVQREKYVK